MTAELKPAPKDWAVVIPTIASALNECSLDRLGHRFNVIALIPLELITGIKPKLPVLRILSESSAVPSRKLSSTRLQYR